MFAPKTPTASPARGGASRLGAARRWLAPAPGMRRRSLLVALPAALAGCGFELRRAPEFRFSSIALAGFKRASPLADELKRSIAASTTTRVAEAASQAQVVLEALADARERSVVASTASGQVREITLRTRLGFRLRTPAGKELIAPTELVLTRDMSYNESAALAKEQEEALLFRAMQSDIVAQVMRRLAAVPAL
jgi:LPS-assembly lipoprotein